MASLKHLLCLIAFLFCAIALLSTPSSCSFEADPPRPRLYTFGDSLFDSGNGLCKNPASNTGKYPYGMSTQNKYMGRYSDGLSLPDYIAIFANLGVLPPSLKAGANVDNGTNFAYPGAGVFGDGNNLNWQIAAFMSLKDKLIKEKGGPYKRAVLTKSVFLFSFGGVTYAMYKNSNPKATLAQKTAYVNSVIDKLKDVIFKIYLEGGRKFAFQNVMPLGCSPANRVNDQQCQAQLQELANLHNAALKEAFIMLKVQLPGFSYSIFDYFTALSDRINNPQTYGMKVSKIACCGRGARRVSYCGTKPYELCQNPNEYVFWDGAHTTQNTNEQLAKLFWSGGPDVAFPINLEQLFQLTPVAINNLSELAVE